MPFPNVHTHTETQNSLEIINLFPAEICHKYFSVGLHPWFLNEENWENEFVTLQLKVRNKKCLAIGECGLDKVCATHYTLQEKVFEKQIILAKETEKPLIIHNVKSHNEIITLLQKNKFHLPVIFHGFYHKKTIADIILKNGYYLSFGKAILEEKYLQQILEKIPIQKFFLETDDSAISIEEIYAKVSEIKKTSLQEVQNVQIEQMQTVFGVFPKNM